MKLTNSLRWFAAFALALVTLAFSVPDTKAQTAPFTVPVWTNAVHGGSVTNAANGGFRVVPGKSYTFTVEYKNLVGSGTNGPLTVYLDGSINGTSWTTTFPVSFTASSYVSGGSLTNREVFTLPATNGALIKQVSHLRVSKFTSVNTNVLTNLVVTARPFDL